MGLWSGIELALRDGRVRDRVSVVIRLGAGLGLATGLGVGFGVGFGVVHSGTINSSDARGGGEVRWLLCCGHCQAELTDS